MLSDVADLGGLRGECAALMDSYGYGFVYLCDARTLRLRDKYLRSFYWATRSSITETETGGEHWLRCWGSCLNDLWPRCKLSFSLKWIIHGTQPPTQSSVKWFSSERTVCCLSCEYLGLLPLLRLLLLLLLLFVYLNNVLVFLRFATNLFSPRFVAHSVCEV